MSTASGSLAFLGAARFQGYWDATTNSATGSGYTGQKLNGVVNGLFSTGSSAAGGYAAATGLTASAGDYWQVTGSGAHNVEGTTSWALNDWCIYSGSAGSAGTWAKLSFDDTIASIVIGDLSASSVFNLTGSSNKQVLFVTGASDTDVVMSGSDNFIYDYVNNRVGIGTSAPVASALLELSGTAQGLLPPRLTTGQRDGISSPATGLVIYNSSTDELNIYDGSSWTTAGGTSINNATENELVTVSSTVTQLDAEANLTFDGSTLKVLGAAAANVVSNIAIIATATTVSAGYNSFMIGPITIADGATLTIANTAAAKIKDISDI
tara:strand:- start:3694 stop:4662 length:969 start_codon:yes stop_codon:yes gene_type:complete